MCYRRRQCADLLLPYPLEGLTIEQVNCLAVRELRKHGGPNDATLVFVEPGMSAQYVRDLVLKNNAVGFKVYMSHATAKDQSNAPIRSFLPEKHINVMDELGLTEAEAAPKPEEEETREDVKEHQAA